MESIKEDMKLLEQRTKELAEKLNLQEIHQQIRKLEAQSMKSDFWATEEHAKQVMKEIAAQKNIVDNLEGIQTKLEDTKKLIDLSQEEVAEDQTLEEALRKDLKSIEKDLKKLETQTFLSGEFDESDAILSIHSGQGGVEAMDWAAMLYRMYVRYFEKTNLKYTVISEAIGEEAGFKSVVVFIEGNYAYGYLKHEAGVHRLVRQSPFNADKLRQTSFALVEVLPQIKESDQMKIREDEVEFHAVRASGHGGQNINKVSTAVRLKHIPTGIVVECQTQRYQEQNRKLAMQLLTAKIWAKQQVEHEKKLKNIKGEHKIAGWGNQIRSYVLHPYHMVKDLRTDMETDNTGAVLDGELQPFIEAEVRQL